jgi:hypothetical protein
MKNLETYRIQLMATLSAMETTNGAILRAIGNNDRDRESVLRDDYECYHLQFVKLRRHFQNEHLAQVA